MNHGCWPDDPADMKPIKTAERTSRVLELVRMERQAQDAKWGQQDHSAGNWALILGEEYGEACQAALQNIFSYEPGDSRRVRKELIQVAAVAVAWVESIDREDA